MIEARTQRPLIRARENRQSTFHNFLTFSIRCYEGVKIIRLFRSHFLSIWAIQAVVVRMTNIFYGKRPIAIAAMNAELPPFKNGEHNSENVYI